MLISPTKILLQSKCIKHYVQIVNLVSLTKGEILTCWIDDTWGWLTPFRAFESLCGPINWPGWIYKTSKNLIPTNKLPYVWYKRDAQERQREWELMCTHQILLANFSASFFCISVIVRLRDKITSQSVKVTNRALKYIEIWCQISQNSILIS